MSDYSVTIKIRNGRIRKRMLDCGFKNVNQLAKHAGVGATALGKLINLKSAPMKSDGTWHKIVLTLADVLGCDPHDLFNETQCTLKLKANSTEKFITEHQMLEHYRDHMAIENQLASDIGEIIDEERSNSRVDKVLELEHNPRNRYALASMLVGKTLRQTGRQLGVGPERTRQMVEKTLRNLRRNNAKTTKILGKT